MDITWQGSVQIDAPVEQVYRYLAELPRHAEWAQSVERLELVRAGDHIGVGAIYRTAERQGWQTDRAPRAPLTRGVAGTTMCELIELIPNRRIAWRSWAPVPGVRHAGAYAFDLAPDERGGTRLTQSAALEDNWLGDLVSRLVFKTTPPKARAQWEASLRNIKALLEQGVELPGEPIVREGASMPTEQLTAIARQFFEEQDRLRGGPADELCAPGYIAHLAGNPPVDLAGHKQFAAMFYAAFPDLGHTIDEAMAEGNRATVRFTLRGTNTGSFMGLPPTGRPVVVPATATFRFDGDRVAELWGEFDQAGMMRQLASEDGEAGAQAEVTGEGAARVRGL